MLQRLALALAAVLAVACTPPLELPTDKNPATGKDTNEPASAADTAAADLEDETPARELAAPLPETPAGTWSWLDEKNFDDVPTCMDGSKTGLGINRSPTGSKKVLFFMMGGAACFDGQTCAIAEQALAADHADAKDFETWVKRFGDVAMMKRGSAENVFRDWNYVYIPYCSGDVFSGANPSGYKGRPQVGFKNVAAYLPRLASTLRDADQAVLTGMSAGGYGAAYNYTQFQRAFDWLDLTVINDSGPPLSSEFTATCLQEKWKKTWLMEETSPVTGTFPLGLDPATGQPQAGLRELVARMATEHPKSKFAFLSHDRDLVMRYFHGIGQSRSCAGPGLLGADTFVAGLRDVRSIASQNFSTFYAEGTGHTFTTDKDYYSATADGVPLAAWVEELVTKGTASHRPATF